MDLLTLNGQKLFQTLHNPAQGREAYLVGGCVRDHLLGRTPKDIDFATSLVPLEAISLLDKDYLVVPTGIDHGTITVIKDSERFEITTYRSDHNCDGRRANVKFETNILEDLKRRDFTINAMAMDINGKILDPFAGHYDLDTKTIECVGDASERFREDHLRILRAFRFSAQLNFRLSPNVLKAVNELKHLLIYISPERIRDELSKILASPNSGRVFKALLHSKVLDTFIPEFSVMRDHPGGGYHAETVDDHTALCLTHECSEMLYHRSPNVQLATLFHDIAKPLCAVTEGDKISFKEHDHIGSELVKRIMARLKYSNNEIDRVSWLVKNHLVLNSETSDKKLRKLARESSWEALYELTTLRMLDSLGNLRKAGSTEDTIAQCNNMISRISKVQEETKALTQHDIKITGHDLLQLGISPGPKMGKIKEKLLELVLEQPELNDREILLTRVKELLLYEWH